MIFKRFLLTLCLNFTPFVGWAQFQIPVQENLEELLTAAPIKEDQYFQKVIKGSNQFGFNFYQQLKSRQGDLLFSPFDISSGIAIVGLGAKGETSAEILNVLNYSTNLSPLINDLEEYLGAHITKQSNIAIGNAIWIQEGIPLVPSFKNTYKKSFNIDLVQVDFSKNPTQAGRTINQWVTNKTSGKIYQILNPGDVGKLTQFILTTSFYFQKIWQTEFDRRKTVKAPFHYKGHPFQVEMMNHIGSYHYLKTEQFEILEIPFESEGEDRPAIVLSIFLPKEGTGLESMEGGLNNTQYSQWISQLQPTNVEIFVPRFRIDGRYDLNPILEGMGMKLAFENQADFSGMSPQRGVFLNKAIHKTSFRIEERGKEIVKYPAQKTEPTAEPEKHPVVKVDRPFFFLVRDRESQLILQMGRLTQP